MEYSTGFKSGLFSGHFSGSTNSVSSIFFNQSHDVVNTGVRISTLH